MIRPEAHQWNWKPKTRSKDDMKLDKDLQTIKKKTRFNKNDIVKIALIFFCETHNNVYGLSENNTILSELLKSSTSLYQFCLNQE